jgi:hypothetical protein
MDELHSECVQNDPLCLKPERFTRPGWGMGLLLRCAGGRIPATLQSALFTTVLLPESFRGGCSFGVEGLGPSISPTVNVGLGPTRGDGCKTGVTPVFQILRPEFKSGRPVTKNQSVNFL